MKSVIPLGSDQTTLSDSMHEALFDAFDGTDVTTYFAIAVNSNGVATTACSSRVKWVDKRLKDRVGEIVQAFDNIFAPEKQ